jgi:hypothetical protein
MSPFGLNMQFGYFYIIIFVKGCFELRKVDFEKFSFGFFPIGVILRFCQGVSNNWHMRLCSVLLIDINFLWIA